MPVQAYITQAANSSNPFLCKASALPFSIKEANSTAKVKASDLALVARNFRLSRCSAGFQLANLDSIKAYNSLRAHLDWTTQQVTSPD